MDTEPLCQRCSHRYGAHVPGCQHTLVSGWDEQVKVHTKSEPCTCLAYVGIDPKMIQECPHETLATDPTFCVCCFKTVPAKKKWLKK